MYRLPKPLNFNLGSYNKRETLCIESSFQVGDDSFNPNRNNANIDKIFGSHVGIENDDLKLPDESANNSATRAVEF